MSFTFIKLCIAILTYKRKCKIKSNDKIIKYLNNISIQLELLQKKKNSNQ